MAGDSVVEINSIAEVVKSASHAGRTGRPRRVARAAMSENNTSHGVGSIELGLPGASVDGVRSVKAKAPKKSAAARGPQTLPFRVMTYHGQILKDFETSSEACRWAKSHVKDGKWVLDIAYGPSRNISP